MRLIIVIALLLAASLPVFPGAPASSALTTIFDLDTAEVLATMRIALPDGRVIVLDTPTSVRGPDFAVTLQDGEKITTLEVAPHLYAGHVAGDDSSWARISVTDEGILAAWSGNGKLELLAPLAFIKGGAPSLAHAILPEPAAETIDDGGVAVDAPPNSAHGDGGVAADGRAALFIDVDHDFYQIHSCVHLDALVDCPESSKRWVTIVEHMVSVVDTMYRRQGLAGLELNGVNGWASKSSPYPYVGGLVDVLQELYRTRDYWESVAPIELTSRNLLELMSGRSPATSFIGFAYLASIDTTYAYSVASVPGVSIRNYVLMAHEIGHNFNGVHEHAGTAPVLGRGGVNTIMTPNICNCVEFTDGSIDPAKNNVARIGAYTFS